MKKIILFLLPIIAWTAWLGWLQFAQSRTAHLMTEANGLTLSQNDKQYFVSTANQIEHEQETVSINILTDDGTQVHSMECHIDWDMGGRGFVRAMNLDDDPELEILCYGTGKDKQRWLDITDTGVNEHPLEQAAPATQQQVRQWLDAHYPNTYAMGLLVVITLFYYFVLVSILLLMFIVQRIRRKKANAA